jgi:hypothetical protein
MKPKWVLCLDIGPIFKILQTYANTKTKKSGIWNYYMSMHF